MYSDILKKNHYHHPIQITVWKFKHNGVGTNSNRSLFDTTQMASFSSIDQNSNKNLGFTNFESIGSNLPIFQFLKSYFKINLKSSQKNKNP